MEKYERLYSELSKDPDLAELVEVFVAEMPNRVELVRAHADAQNWEQLGRAAHQLKGAAGSYGFHDLTRPALRLEQAATRREPESQILQAVDELVELCSRIASGRAPVKSNSQAAQTSARARKL